MIQDHKETRERLVQPQQARQGSVRPPHLPNRQGSRTLGEAMKGAGVGPPRQNPDTGGLEYPGGIHTWRTSGGQFEGGTGVSTPNQNGEHLGSNYQFFDRNGNRINTDSMGNGENESQGR